MTSKSDEELGPYKDLAEDAFAGNTRTRRLGISVKIPKVPFQESSPVGPKVRYSSKNFLPLLPPPTPLSILRDQRPNVIGKSDTKIILSDPPRNGILKSKKVSFIVKPSLEEIRESVDEDENAEPSNKPNDVAETTQMCRNQDEKTFHDHNSGNWNAETTPFDIVPEFQVKDNEACGPTSLFMSGRERQPGRGGVWQHRRLPAAVPNFPYQNVKEVKGKTDSSIRFAGGADLGLATTACSSSLLSFHRVLPSPVGSSIYSSGVTSPGSFLSGSSGSAPSSGPFEKEVGCSDLTGLNPLSADTILHNLTTRHKRDHIYTFMGTALIAINPYKELAIYSDEQLRTYDNSSVFQLPPHIYSIADRVHRGVYERHQDQVLVVSGESGAGKTETVKLVLQYVAAQNTYSDTVLDQMILQTNPVLEAFGNARTKENDNSSRFAKYMDVEFDFKGTAIGGTISCYLLERFRVTSHTVGERNFHIFYQLLSGTETQLLKTLKLKRNTENYNILKSNRQHSMGESVNDKAEFLVTKRALDLIGISSSEQLDIFRIVASVLILSNISFTSVNNIDGTEGCVVQNEYELHDVSELLQCDINHLTVALQSRLIESRNGEVFVELSASEAVSGRNALCRALYSRLFSWLVNRINDAIKVKTKENRKVLGLLDLCGFETVDKNGFQQLIINFCNEKLHQTITTITLKELQEEYIREGIEWSHIEYATNYSTVEILELNKTGILNIIEDVTIRRYDTEPVGGDEEILREFLTSCGTHPNFEIKGMRSQQHCDNNLPGDAFRVRHYAGAVAYSIRGFTEKNTDNLSKTLSHAMFNCNHPILKAIFPEGNSRRASLKRPNSVISQVQVSVGALMKTMQGKMLNQIYCLKPNQMNNPRVIESAFLLHQISYLGLVEQTRLQLEGWVMNCLHEEFLERYKMLCLHTWPSWSGASLDGCAILFADLSISPSQYSFGRTKVFVKSQRTVNLLEHHRRIRLEKLAIAVQKVWRGFKDKKNYIYMKKSHAIIVKAWRRWRTLKHDPEISLAFETSSGWKFFSLALKELRNIKYKKKTLWAARVIECSYVRYQRLRLLNQLVLHPPSDSPTSIDWPHCPLVVYSLSIILRRIHHGWRCHQYRLRFDQTSRNRMREKVTASLIFKDRKASYFRSITHPFLGDYVRLRQNGLWKRMANESNDQYLVFADMVNKIARSSGKFVPILLAISTNALLVLDQRTLQIKYRIPAADIIRISLSPFLDDIAVLHVKPPTPTLDLSASQNLNPGCLFGSDEIKRKGDLIIQTGHIIEVVTKLFLVVQNAVGKPPEIAICTEFDANFGQSLVLFSFRAPNLASEVTTSQIRIVRRQNRMDVIL